ncbi:putative transmembrane protein [Helianthus annuus]|nr:putative transmembrane protein [Helianthus annuus]KAJ0543185.1 putative transmembrane protein [Helianthus annuus]KAJ0708236.1 putative transmembrane protein [Helianthus annuus]KAJ0712194.1 putative transmembrane protein [Helianthus annuus]
MIHHRGFCHDVEALHYKVVALCAVLWLTTFGPCTMTGTQNLTGYDEYGSYKSGSSSGSEDVLVQVQSSVPNLNLENICRRSDLFCFPSTLSGFFSDFHSTDAANVSGFSGVKRDDTVVVGTTQPNRANFQLMNGSIVSCSLELKESVRDSDDENDTSSVFRIKSNRVNDFSSQSVQISHPLLDWGRKYLHFPSLAYLTVENRHKSSVLNVFESYCTNTQFYPCNYTEIKIRPGETASLCFVFLPKQLGLSSGHLILQTSSGGFLVRAQGFAVQPPYMLQSSIGSGSSPWVISLSNPSNEVLHLKEVSARMSISSGNVSYVVDGVCSMIDRAGSVEYSAKEWVDVKVGQLGQLGMAIRPQKTWTVGSNSNEPILEVEFPYRSQTNVYGSFCVQLLNNASRDNVDTIVFEAEYGGKSKSNDLETRLSISLDVLMPCDVNGTTVVSLLVENDGPDLLSVVKISTVGDNIESLQSKYVEGLILFPHTVTQVAMVTYTPNLHTNLDCKLVVHTNKSNDPELEIPCSHFAGLCSRSHSYAESRSRNVHVHQPSELKVSKPGESRKIIVSYHAETCVETVLRDLELGMVGGILVVPVKVSLPKLTLTTCKRSLFWIKFKKVVLAALVSVLLIFMACSYMFSVIIRDGNLSETHSSDVCLKPDTINKVVVTSLSLSSPEASDLELKSTAVESPKPENLTVKTGKDKARRRKKKRSSGTGLTGYLDGLSSHSSNSTPSSPLSPVKCSTPKRSPQLSPSQYVRARSPFSNGGSSTVVPVKDKPSTPPKTPTPFERAPGAERKAVKPEEKPGYNIWDYHLQLCDLGVFEVGSVMLPTIAKDNLVSFFEISPQELFTISGADIVSCKQND